MLGSDLTWWLSSVGASEGGAKSAVAITDNTPQNVWTNYSAAQRISGVTAYRKTFVTNDHASETLDDPVVWIADPPDNMTEDIGLGFDSADDADPLQGSLGAWSAGAVASLESDGADTRQVEVTGLVGTTRTVETKTLTGTTPVLTTAVFTTVFAVRPLSTSGTRTITVKQGSGGTTRGTIGPGKGNLFRWFSTALSKATGLKLPDLTAGSSIGLWHRQTVAPGATAAPSNLSVIAIEPEVM